MIIETKFERLARVKIIALGINGVVIGFYRGGHEVEYQIRYTYDGECKTAYFFDWELKVIQENSQ